MEQSSYGGGELSPSPLKKKRGRPRKSETAPLSEKRKNGNRNMAKLAAVDHQVRAKLKPDQNATVSGDTKPLVGQSVHGVVDGSFDAGYLVTIRVGDTDTVYRGVVFGPGLSIPVNKDNDVAPKVKNTKAVASPADSPSPMPPPPAVPVPAAAPLPTPADAPTRNLPSFSVTPAPVGAGSSLDPSDFRSSFDQEMMGFMYPGLAQLHSGGSHGFFPRGFGYPFQLPAPAPAAAAAAIEYGSANALFAAANAQGAAPPPRPAGS